MTARLLAIAALICALALPGVAQQHDQAAERQLLQLLNQERQRAGLPALKWDERLQRAARQHSELMAEKQQLSHQFAGEARVSKRLAAQNIRLNNDGENVAFDESAEAAHEGFMRSPPHRANIIGPQYNAAGIGVVRQGGTLWVTEDFAHVLPEHSLGDAEDMIVTAFVRARAQAHMPPARRVHLPQARELACEMARTGRLDARVPLRLPDVRSAVVYTETEPDHLPASGLKLAADAKISRVAAAACFATSDKYPAGTYWVVMVFY